VRAATAVVVTLASAAAVGVAWQSGLRPTGPALGATAVVPAAPAASPRAGSAATGAAGAPPTPHSRSRTTGTPAAPPKVVDGPLVQTQYGGVQVAVRYAGRRILDVTALHLTDSSDTSVSISAQAAPVLRQEALAAQSAQIDMVSGASFTSQAYVQSLQAALDAAHL
jgi:uncharacterized protein with FMN-binding domain